MNDRRIELRTASANDLEFLWHAYRETMREHVERAFGRWDDEERHRHFLDRTDPNLLEIIEIEGRPIGSWWVRPKPGALELVRIQVLPEEQGRGIGTRLVRSLCERAAAAGLAVRLRVFLNNPAQRLYRRLGFRVTEETETHFHMEYAAPSDAL